MFASKIILALAASTVASASLMHLAERVPVASIEKRAVAQGWSLQAATCPADSDSCGTSSCCPKGTFCNKAGNSEVSACCAEDSDCRGAVEGAPICADSTWSFWQGYQGNGFCCEVGMVGVYDTSSGTAGTCVSSAGSGVTPAVLKSTGSGKAATAVASVKASATAAVTTAAVAATQATTSAAASVASATSAASAATADASSGASASASASASSTAVVAAASGAAGKLQAGLAGLVGVMAVGLAL